MKQEAHQHARTRGRAQREVGRNGRGQAHNAKSFACGADLSTLTKRRVMVGSHLDLAGPVPDPRIGGMTPRCAFA
jgi:hypothetical protein